MFLEIPLTEKSYLISDAILELLWDCGPFKMITDNDIFSSFFNQGSGSLISILKNPQTRETNALSSLSKPDFFFLLWANECV